MLPDWGWTSRHTDGDISVLAIAETIAASVLAIAIVYWTGSVLHILIGACLAPFLMLRSPASVEDGANRFNEYIYSIAVPKSAMAQRFIKLIVTLPIFEFYPKLLIVTLFIRVTSTLRFVGQGFPLFGRNYFNALFCQDTASGVSLVPGVGSVRNQVRMFTAFGDLGWRSALYLLGLFAAMVGVDQLMRFADARGWTVVEIGLTVVNFGFMLVLLNFVASYVFVFIAFWFRWSVKSTALIWLPIIFLASRMPRGKKATTRAIQEERPSGTAKLIRAAAWVALAFFGWRALIFPSTHQWWLAQDWAAPFLAIILPLGTGPHELNLWHIASGLNAVLILSTFFLLWEKYGRSGKTARPVTVGARKLYQGYFWLRGLLSIYTVACGLYFVWRATEFVQIAGINFCLFPAMAACQ